MAMGRGGEVQSDLVMTWTELPPRRARRFTTSCRICWLRPGLTPSSRRSTSAIARLGWGVVIAAGRRAPRRRPATAMNHQRVSVRRCRSFRAVEALQAIARVIAFVRPTARSLTNGVRFAFLAFGLPLAMRSKVARRHHDARLDRSVPPVAIWVGQKRERFSFARQDLTITIAMFMMIGLWERLRWVAGFGTCFDTFLESLPKIGQGQQPRRLWKKPNIQSQAALSVRDGSGGLTAEPVSLLGD